MCSDGEDFDPQLHVSDFPIYFRSIISCCLMFLRCKLTPHSVTLWLPSDLTCFIHSATSLPENCLVFFRSEADQIFLTFLRKSKSNFLTSRALFSSFSSFPSLIESISFCLSSPLSEFFVRFLTNI